ncbi:DUF421 domain-containing protein [Hymenobacter gummosus]|uniref:DUF421 domain-containing protein n=1 Tax=Hymenobacter gummosus TaxID=1776032 RepID=A0A3S0H3H8_9BACT|nr:YetF domain-containing protein [Hymenobacter gummosus]RTQ47883.1 DUF421 domain-containing protein [Hymenobacter gummosus]
MKPEDIHLWDLKRILLGQAPGEFMLEVLIRSLIMFVALLIVFRLLGKRMNAQLTVTEMGVMITLGAIIAVPAQIPDRGLVVGLAALLTALALQRGLNYWAVHRRPVEVTLHGDATLLVKDGVLQTEELTRANISHEQLFAQLRAHDVLHLGQVRRVYQEGGGHFSVFHLPQPRPGLSVLPLKDQKLHGEEARAEGLQACLRCATVVDAPAAQRPCPTCGQQEWTYAVPAEEQAVAKV